MHGKLISDAELLSYVINSANIDLGSVRNEMTRKKKEQIVNKHHPYKIFEGTDGRWKTTIEDKSRKDGRRLVARKNREDLIDFLYEIYEDEEILKQEEIQKEKNRKITLESIYPEWLEYKRIHTDAETYITRIESDWKKFYINTSIIKVPLCQLTKLMLDEWAHTIIQKYSMTKNCYYNMRTIFNQALEYAVAREIIDSNPMSSVKINAKLFRKVKKKPNETQVYSDMEKNSIIPLAYRDFHTRCKVYQLSPLALIFQFLTGVRIGELCALKYSDLERENYIHVQHMLRRDLKEVVEYTKTEAGDREIYLVKEAREIIDLCRERQRELGVNTDYIFSVTEMPITERCVIDLLKKYTKELDILYRSSHKVRKTAGSTIVDAVNINTAREMLGHEDERTTLKYYCFDRTPKDERENQFEEAFLRC